MIELLSSLNLHAQTLDLIQRLKKIEHNKQHNREILAMFLDFIHQLKSELF